MGHYYLVNFRYDNGGAATGLTPLIYIWDVATSTLIVNGDPTVEVGGGWYSYLFEEVAGNVYVATFDAGSVAGLTNRFSDGVMPGSYDSSLLALATALATLQADMDAAMVLLNSISKVEYGSWDVQPPNVLTFYDTDNVTPIAIYNTYDINGNPATSEITRVVKQ